jgi:hypothetical protein
VLVAVLGLITQNVTVAALGLGAWCVWTLWFAAFRLRRTSHAPRHVAEMIVTSAVIPLLAVFWRIAGALRFKVLFA